MIFFTSDNHFGHGNIIKYCNRPFTSTNEMNTVMIERWNSVVKSNDIIWHLGDFGMGSFSYLSDIFLKLNGRKCLIKGSHDKREVTDLPWVIKKDVELLSLGKISIFLSHYPHRSWPRSFHGSWHLYGHVHGRTPPWGKSFDVGVDCWDFTPVPLAQVEEKISSLGWEEKDRN